MKVLLRDAAQRETGLIHEKDELQQRVITSCDCHFTSAIKILMFCCYSVVGQQLSDTFIIFNFLGQSVRESQLAT